MTQQIGIDLSDVATFKNGAPLEAFDAIRSETPVLWQPVASGTATGGFWSLTRYEDISAVSRDPKRFTVTRGAAFPPGDLELFKDQMMQQDPPGHTRLRRIVMRGFTPKVVANFDTWIRDIVVSTLDRLETMDSFDFVNEVAAVVPAFVIADIVGVPRERQPDIFRWANIMFSVYSENIDAETHRNAAESIFNYGLELRDLKQKEPGDDIITGMVNSPEQLTDQEFRCFFTLLLIAGFETTHTMMAQGMRLVLENEYIAEQLRAQCERGASDAFVEEVLRFATPVYQMARTATEDLVLGDQNISEGDLVVMWYPSANRDPAVFKDPNTFMATRTPNPHMGFGGGGTHFCLGSHLARLEGRILFEELHKRGMEFELDGEPKQSANLQINQLAKLPVVRR